MGDEASGDRDRRVGEGQLVEIEQRDWQLWILALLIIAALTFDVVILRLPRFVGDTTLSVEVGSYLIALPVLSALFCAYAVQTVGTLKVLRRRLSTTELQNDEIRSSLKTVAEQSEKLRASEEALRLANDKLRKLDQMKSDFISTVSHELRTPLTSIKNATQLILSGRTGEITTDQERFLQMAVRNIDRLGGVVNDVLSLSRLEAGKVEFRFTELDLGPVLVHAVSTFAPEADARSLTLSAIAPANLPPVFADQARIEQILCNLLSNAMKFTPSGGRVTVSASAHADSVVLKVVDTGIGMSAEDQGRVFDRFHQAGDPLTRTQHGTGIGLSISRELVHAHGGEIRVTSKLDHGSCFSFDVPVLSDRSRQMAELEQEFQRSRSRDSVSILVVEDEGTIASGGGPASLVSERLGRLDRDIRRCVRRAEDVLLPQPAYGRLVVLLPGTSKWEALEIRKKLAAVLPGPSDEDGALSCAPRLSGIATYPEDGTSARELLDLALVADQRRRKAYG